MSSLAHPEPGRPGWNLLRFLALSLLLHALLLAWLGRARFTVDDYEPPPVVVKLAPAPPPRTVQKPGEPAKPATPPQVREQIVAPSDQENQLPPLGRAYLSDRDNRVDRESVRRGNPEAGVPNAPKPEQAPPPEPPVAARPPAPKPAAAPARAKAKTPPKPAPRRETQPAERRAPSRGAVAARRDRSPPPPPRSLPGLQDLLPPPAEVLGRARADGASGEAGASAADPRADPRRDLTGAPPPAPGLFAGLRGTFDDLPDVAAGNLTMLNTKADRFAPFVRRVGTRVFQNLLIYQRRDLDVPEILAANRQVTVRALLDRNGKLKDLEIIDRSGSNAMDDTLLDALREAAFDHNPPPEAANGSGEFEFLFQAQLSAGVVPGASGPQVRTVESRLRIGLL